MADLRHNTAIKDDFDYVEDPLSNGGKWAQTFPGFWAPLAADGSSATNSSGQTLNASYWTQETMDGDDAQCWALASGGGEVSGIAWDIQLITAASAGTGAINGYGFRDPQGTFVMRRYDSGTLIDNLDTATGLPGFSGNLVMIRRNGADVEGLVSTDLGANWTLYVSITDTNYVNGLVCSLRIADNAANQELGWDYFGGGVAEDFVPQFIRRPWRYKGRDIMANAA